MKKLSTIAYALSARLLKYKSISIILIIGVLGLGYFGYTKTQGSTSSSTYTFKRVRKEILEQSVSGDGQIIADSQITLRPVVAGTISNVTVKSGDVVRKNTRIASIYSYDAIKTVRDAKLALDQAALALAKLKQGPDTLTSTQIQNTINQAEETKKSQQLTLSVAKRTLLNAGLIATPKYSFSGTAPVLGGSYSCDTEGSYEIKVSGDIFQYSGLESGIGTISSTNVPQALGSCGLTVTFASGVSYINGDWTITTPNTLSASYAATINSYTTAVLNANNTIAGADRTIAEQKAKLALLISPNALDIQSAELTVEQRQNALSDANNNLSNYSIVAPFDGVVSSIGSNVGDYVNQSTSIGVITTKKKLAQVTLNEVDITKVKIGEQVNLMFDAVDGLKITGEIVDIDSIGTVTQGVVSYTIKIAFTDDNPLLKVGMSVTAKIITDKKENVLAVPLSAIKSTGTQKTVLVIDPTSLPQNLTPSYQNDRRATSTLSEEDKTSSSESTSTKMKPSQKKSGRTVASDAVTTKSVPVTLGIQSDTNVEILSGLAEGDLVVTKIELPTTATKAAAPSILSSFGGRGGSGTKAQNGGGR